MATFSKLSALGNRLTPGPGIKFVLLTCRVYLSIHLFFNETHGIDFNNYDESSLPGWTNSYVFLIGAFSRPRPLRCNLDGLMMMTYK